MHCFVMGGFHVHTSGTTYGENAPWKRTPLAYISSDCASSLLRHSIEFTPCLYG